LGHGELVAFHGEEGSRPKQALGGEMATPPRPETRPQEIHRPETRPQEIQGQAPGEPGFDAASMDDFEVIRERRNVMAGLARLTDQYRALNQEIQRRETLQWMLAR
jgi:hypothetical protein